MSEPANKSDSFHILIDGQSVEVQPGQSVLSAARRVGLDIPTLCYLEKCGPLNSCLVCLVKINGKLVPSCGTKVHTGMVVESESTEVHEARRTALELLFSDHVGDCLSPCNRLCPLGLNIPLMLRQIQAGRYQEASGTLRGTLPLGGVLGRLCHHPCEQGCRRGHWDEPASIRNLERFVSDWDSGRIAPDTAPPVVAAESAHGNGQHHPQGTSGAVNPVCKTPSGKSVVIVGAGPTGLAAAYYLVRQGHHVTVTHRGNKAGGSLRQVPAADLPVEVLDAELELLRHMGVDFKPSVTLGQDVTVEGLSRGFDAILLAIGKLDPAHGKELGIPMAGNLVRTDPNTCKTPLGKVFAAGAITREVRQLVRAMGEGRAAAECIHRFLCSQAVRRPEKVFSSVMGRLDPGELRQFLACANGAKSVSPCDRCAGLSRREAVAESARCLHCDCRSSGNCVLQHYAQTYGADAGRFRAERKSFEQLLQPGGVIFEPGKCILCGICVKLTEIAKEPLGLTFIGRGFDVRVAAPFDRTIEEGLQKVAVECVRHCPTGALVFANEEADGSRL